MGMYTELFLQVELKEDTPNEIIDTLRYMMAEDVEEPVRPPFTADRWKSMLRMVTFTFPVGHRELTKCELSKNYYLLVRCELKDYDGEILKFLNWIAPYITDNTHYQGHYLYEQDEEPTRFYFREGKVLDQSEYEEYKRSYYFAHLLKDPEDG